MATYPYFVLGPNAALSIAGLLRGADRTVPSPLEDWRAARVDVVIPAFNEAQTIVFCLASLMRQTLKPRQIILIDDGSTDGTIDSARLFCEQNDVKLIAIQRRKSIGKTPTIKRQAREFDSDVEFILDGDTILESPDYLERVVQELYQGVGIASACGTILPFRRRDRRAIADDPVVKAFAGWPAPQPVAEETLWRTFARGVTNLYREVLYLFLQRFVYRGQMVFFGSITNPVGCAVAYRRKYVEKLFDHFGPIFGDDLTNSEDIFIGMALLNEGYRNIQLTDVYARTVEPLCTRLPRQVYMWSSSFLQSCYYFDPLVRSPLRIFKRTLLRRQQARTQRTKESRVQVTMPALAEAGFAPVSRSAFPPVMLKSAPTSDVLEYGPNTPTATSDRRRAREAYRQPFGREYTLRYGRPVGWLLMTSLIEKIFFPTVLLTMALWGNWEAFWVTVACESIIALMALVIVTRGQRLEYFFKGLAVVPLRYALVVSELVTLGRFAVDLWITRNRKWRK